MSNEKKVVDVNTEFKKGRGDAFDDIMSVSTGGIFRGSTSDHYSATVTYDNGSVGTGSGRTKEDAIRRALK